MEGMLNISEAASPLGVSVNTVRRLVYNEQLEHARYANKLFFSPAVLDTYIADHTTKAAA